VNTHLSATMCTFIQASRRLAAIVEGRLKRTASIGSRRSHWTAASYCPPPTKPSGEGNATFDVPQLSPLALGQRPLLLCRVGTGLDLELGTGVTAGIAKAQIGLRVHEFPI
jgi:hypothetical protein